MGEVIRVAISKAGKGKFIEVNTDDLNAAEDLHPGILTYLVGLGLKAVANARMSKIAAPTKLEGAALEANAAAALKIANENIATLMEGKTKKTSAAKEAGVDRAVMTEALRLAKNVVKDELRKAKVKISHVAPKELTAKAKYLVENDPQYIEDAKAELAKRAEVKSSIDIVAMVKTDPALVAKAEKEAAERKAARQLSAKQAGIVEKRTKGKVPPQRPASVN